MEKSSNASGTGSKKPKIKFRSAAQLERIVTLLREDALSKDQPDGFRSQSGTPSVYTKESETPVVFAYPNRAFTQADGEAY